MKRLLELYVLLKNTNQTEEIRPLTEKLNITIYKYRRLGLIRENIRQKIKEYVQLTDELSTDVDILKQEIEGYKSDHLSSDYLKSDNS